jgi:hypothetical protein
MERREFLAGCGMLLLGTRAGQAQTRGPAAPAGQDRSPKLARIGVLSWSLHTMWEKNQPPGTPPPAKPWDV